MPSYRRILPSPFRRIFRRIPPSSFRRFRRIPRRRHSGEFPKPVVIPANSPSSFRRIPRRHSGEFPVVIPAHAGIQCNNESPGATRYLTGYRDKPGMTMKVNAAIPANSSAVILGHVVSQWTTVFQTRNTYSLPGSLSQSGGKLLRLSM